jgi:hypothetical protein
MLLPRLRLLSTYNAGYRLNLTNRKYVSVTRAHAAPQEPHQKKPQRRIGEASPWKWFLRGLNEKRIEVKSDRGAGDEDG